MRSGNRTREIGEAKIQLLSQVPKTLLSDPNQERGNRVQNGGTEIRTDHHARTKTSDRRVTAEEKQLGQVVIEKKSVEQTGRGNWSEPSPSRPATQENRRGRTKLPTQIRKYSTRVSKQGNRSPDQQHKTQNSKFSINFTTVHN
jgi:hypothetical protein